MGVLQGYKRKTRGDKSLPTGEIFPTGNEGEAQGFVCEHKHRVSARSHCSTHGDLLKINDNLLRYYDVMEVWSALIKLTYD